MHSDVRDYAFTRASSLEALLQQMAAAPGRYTPMAGGTELMVALNTGRLTARELVSIRHLPELRFVRVEADTIHLGAACTFTDLRRSSVICEQLPLLAQAASWTGSIANQNRATLGGNLCNASPAADTPPVLLAYGAHALLISAAGVRTVPYSAFHLGYKRTALRADELLHSVVVPVPKGDRHPYLRKVGTRKAQAISKVALAAMARLEDGRIEEIRLGAASLADRPLQLVAVEAALRGAALDADALDTTVRLARAALASEAKPIDDIRSTARYRVAVAANLLEEFVRSLASATDVHT